VKVAMRAALSLSTAGCYGRGVHDTVILVGHHRPRGFALRKWN
jgi:hypothetical protein